MTWSSICNFHSSSMCVHPHSRSCFLQRATKSKTPVPEVRKVHFCSVKFPVEADARGRIHVPELHHALLWTPSATWYLKHPPKGWKTWQNTYGTTAPGLVSWRTLHIVVMAVISEQTQEWCRPPVCLFSWWGFGEVEASSHWPGVCGNAPCPWCLGLEAAQIHF